MIWLALLTFSAILLLKVRWLSTITSKSLNSNLFLRLLSVTWGEGVPKILLERGGGNPEGGGRGGWGGGWYRKGELPLFYYFTVQLHLLCVKGKSSFLYYILIIQFLELQDLQDLHFNTNRNIAQIICLPCFFSLYIQNFNFNFKGTTMKIKLC